MKTTVRSNFGTFFVSLLTRRDITVGEAAKGYGRTPAAFHDLLTKEPSSMNGKTVTKLAELVGLSYVGLICEYKEWLDARSGSVTSQSLPADQVI